MILDCLKIVLHEFFQTLFHVIVNIGFDGIEIRDLEVAISLGSTVCKLFILRLLCWSLYV